MKRLLLLSLFLCVAAHASDLIVSVTEKTTSTTTPFRISAQTLHAARGKPSEGHVLPRIHKYTIANWQLSAAGQPLTKATEILFQTTADGADFVVLRDEDNSRLGLLNFLLFLGGHPVQVSKIAVVRVISGRLVARRELTSKEASYRWSATITK